MKCWSLSNLGGIVDMTEMQRKTKAEQIRRQAWNEVKSEIRAWVRSLPHKTYEIIKTILVRGIIVLLLISGMMMAFGIFYEAFIWFMTTALRV